ncbi:hypothetical protein D3C75_1292580 [compost metagenome]
MDDVNAGIELVELLGRALRCYLLLRFPEVGGQIDAVVDEDEDECHDQSRDDEELAFVPHGGTSQFL